MVPFTWVCTFLKFVRAFVVLHHQTFIVQRAFSKWAVTSKLIKLFDLWVAQNYRQNTEILVLFYISTYNWAIPLWNMIYILLLLSPWSVTWFLCIFVQKYGLYNNVSHKVPLTPKDCEISARRPQNSDSALNST